MGLWAKLCRLSGEADLMTRESLSREVTLGLFVIDPIVKNMAAMQRLRRSVFRAEGLAQHKGSKMEPSLVFRRSRTLLTIPRDGQLLFRKETTEANVEINHAHPNPLLGSKHYRELSP